jgi:hypothetical protein
LNERGGELRHELVSIRTALEETPVAAVQFRRVRQREQLAKSLATFDIVMHVRALQAPEQDVLHSRAKYAPDFDLLVGGAKRLRNGSLGPPATGLGVVGQSKFGGFSDSFLTGAWKGRCGADDSCSQSGRV